MLIIEMKDVLRPDCPFRSVTDLKAYADSEEIPDYDLTDQNWESVASIVARMQRGESVATRPAYYESDYESDKDTLLDGLNPTDSYDFDLADASRLQYELSQSKPAPKGGQGGTPPATPPAKAVEPSPAGEGGEKPKE